MHRRPIHVAALLATLVLCASLLHADDLLAPTPTPKPGISIQLPKDWKLQPHDSIHILLSASAPAQDSDTTGLYTAGLTITKTAGSSVDGTAQQARLSHDFPDYAITEKPTPITIDGIDGVMFGGTFSAGSLKLRSRQYLLTQGDHIFTLTVTSLASTWDLHLPAIHASVLSFHIDKK